MGALISLGEPINNSLPYDKGFLSRRQPEPDKHPENFLDYSI
jgi:hypothetical protein